MASKPRAMPIIGINNAIKNKNGGGNIEGHPSPETVKRLRKTNSVSAVTTLLMFSVAI
jgi:tetrahydromethanopterin S-methyltransferase subunit D